MGTAAQLAGIGHVHHAHHVTILLAEQRHGTGGDSLVIRHLADDGGRVAADLGVDDGLDRLDLFRRHRLVVAEVEAGVIRIDQRTLLRHMIAQHLAQCLVQQVGGRVVAGGLLAQGRVDLCLHGVAHFQTALFHATMVAPDGGLDLLRVGHGKAQALPLQMALVAHLAAGFSVERAHVQHHHALVTGLEFLRRLAVVVQRQHAGLGRQLVVAHEAGGFTVVFQQRSALEAAGGTRLLALVRHGRLEAGLVHRHAALAADIGRQVQRETIGVVQAEGRLAVQHLLALQSGQRPFQQAHAVGNGLEEAGFLALEHFLDAGLIAFQLGIGLTHFLHQRRHQAVEERLTGTHLVAVAHGTADDPAQHVAAALVARHHAVDDGEAAGTDVVGDDLQRRAARLGRAAGVLHCLGRRGQQVHEQVDLVVGMHVLQHGRHPLQTHAGIHAGTRQRMQLTGFIPVVLHEDDVPDLDEAVTVLLGASRRATGNLGTVVIEDLGARAAGAGVTHHPEVVRRIARALVVADAHDALGRHAHLLGPDVVGLVVLGIDRHQQLLGRQLEDRGQQLPGKLDGVLLEVVAKREVAHHLEEGVMARGVADVFQVVVLAAGADALLSRGGAAVGTLVEAQEDILELVHARVGEQERGIVMRHHRAGRDNGMALGLEELQVLLAYFGGLHHGYPVEEPFILTKGPPTLPIGTSLWATPGSAWMRSSFDGTTHQPRKVPTPARESPADCPSSAQGNRPNIALSSRRAEPGQPLWHHCPKAEERHPPQRHPPGCTATLPRTHRNPAAVPDAAEHGACLRRNGPAFIAPNHTGDPTP